MAWGIRLTATAMLMYVATLFPATKGMVMSAFFQEPELSGPDGVCLNGAFVYANFSAGGDPNDRYIWSIKDADGFELFYQSGGSDVESIEFPFTSIGEFTVSLRVIRGDNQNYYQETKTVAVERGPRFVLAPDVVLCGSETVTLQALDPDDPNFSRYSFEWLDTSNNVLGTENTFETNRAGRYYVKVSSIACEAVASTYVGPSIQVEVEASTTVACLGETVNYKPDSPYLAEWSYQMEGQSERTFLEQSYNLALDTDELEGLGTYTIFFNVDDPERPGCSVEKSFGLEVRDAPQFRVVKISDAASCDDADGEFEIIADEALESVTISGVADGDIGQMEANSRRTVSNLEPRSYTVTGTVGSCTVTRRVNIENENPEEGIQFSISTSPQGCSSTGTRPGRIIIDFLGASQTGKYRIVSDDGREYEGDFQNETELTVEVPKGNYTVEVGDNNNCTSASTGVEEVEGPNQVSFSIPDDLTVCESFDLLPESSQDLVYRLTRPDGSQEDADAGETFLIDASGTYRLLGTPVDPDSPLCPRTRTFEVTVTEPLEFDYSNRLINCFGNQIYTAELFGRDPNTVIIRWMTPDREIVGRDEEFFPPGVGDYLLEVQPRASSACPIEPILFTVAVPENSVDVALEGTPFCGDDPFTTLTAEVEDMDLVHKIEWFKLDGNGESEWLFDLDDELSIDVAEEGIYEVVVRNEINCRMGSTEYEVERFEIADLEIQESYNVCAEENLIPTIKPGLFASYEWRYEGELVGEADSYRPLTAGNYELTVTDANGCEQVHDFEVIDRCESLVKFPNAMMPENPDKDFRVFIDPDVDHVEVFIYQRTGELIHYCESTHPDPSGPVCVWNGWINGKKVSIGTYPLVIKYKSNALGIDRVVKASIVVVE
ncbi:hypothetical protein [Negadavirga shengliensis]|uniref:Ig-like domain-containing protein n=1 Tax=Negadavirga shengliensis TaxID=1389218 RepID=A0ABV9T278_9BACT